MPLPSEGGSVNEKVNMFMTIGGRIKLARKARRLSQEELGELIGVTRAAVSHWEKGIKNPRPENVEAVERVLGVDLSSDAVAPATERTVSPATKRRTALQQDNKPVVGRAGAGLPFVPGTPLDLDQMPNDVPVLGIGVGGDDADFYFNGDVVDYVGRPPGLARTAGVFAIHYTGESMWPRFEAGELVLASSARPPVAGEYCIVELLPEEGERAGKSYVKRWVKRTPESVVVEQLNPPKQIEFPADAVKAVYRVIPMAEAIGTV